MNWIPVTERLPESGIGIPYMKFMTTAVLLRGSWREDYPIVGHFILEQDNHAMGANMPITFAHPGGYKWYSARCAYIPDLADLAPMFKGLLPRALTKSVTHWMPIPGVTDNSPAVRPGYCERHPEAKIINHVVVCGAPQCCPVCCEEAADNSAAAPQQLHGDGAGSLYPEGGK